MRRGRQGIASGCWFCESQLTPPRRQAARKNATLRATYRPISACSVLGFTSNSARSRKGTTARSRQNRAVVARRFVGERRQRPKLVGSRHPPRCRAATSILSSRAVRMTWRGGLLIPEFRSKPRPQLPNRHRLAVDADPIPGIRFGPLLELADENDMTGTPQFIKPHPDIRAGDSQGIFVCVRHRQVMVRAPINAGSGTRPPY